MKLLAVLMVCVLMQGCSFIRYGDKGTPYSLRPLALQERHIYHLTIAEYSRLISVDAMGLQGTATVVFTKQIDNLIRGVKKQGAENV